MLHKDPFIIDPKTISLIKELQAVPELKNFYLVGGTSLALQLGHRNSIDIDLFTRDEFTPDEIFEILRHKFTVEIVYSKKNTLLSTVNAIKTDFVRHDFSLINPPVIEEDITFLGKEDIAAMKLHAITQSGKRLKDFIDVYFLLEHFSLSQMLGFFEKKYPQTNPVIAFRAVNYFVDIDRTIDPPKLRKPVSLAEIKGRILEATVNTHKKF